MGEGMKRAFAAAKATRKRCHHSRVQATGPDEGRCQDCGAPISVEMRHD